MRNNKYDSETLKKKYNFLTDDMLYNIILNLRNNDLTFDDLAENLGITSEELLIYLTKKDKDFFLFLEGISYFEQMGIYTDYSKIKNSSYENNGKSL